MVHVQPLNNRRAYGAYEGIESPLTEPLIPLLYLRSIGTISVPFTGSAIIKPLAGFARKLAVTTTHEKGATGEDALMAAAHSNAAIGAEVYAPLAHKDNNGVLVRTDSYPITALQQVVIHKFQMPANIHGSAVVTSNRRMAVTVNVVDHGRVDGLFSYTGISR